MKSFFSEIRSAVLVTLMLALVCCGLYPLLVFGLGQLLFRDKANGSLITDSSGTVRGSRLLGQQFTGEKYFHSRPSAAGNGYDATSSGGSNLGPTSQKLHDSVAQNIADYRSQNGLETNAPVPADAVTASASGLDPHISPTNAELQASRVAKVRGLPLDKVRALIEQHTDRADLNVLGDPGVNVLELNLALDALAPAPAASPVAQTDRE
ncbi:MAG TPA: K(+)-transporting ATPase subunit C [Verrucomicrobiae bacterium]|nr:K(+)-transporting ATPase subunit C [Verrucomicrobiae bacterium]